VTPPPLPADWTLRSDGMVETAFDGVLPLEEAVILYELKATRSRSVDHDLGRRVAP
jgi:hypothetical protein